MYKNRNYGVFYDFYGIYVCTKIGNYMNYVCTKIIFRVFMYVQKYVKMEKMTKIGIMYVQK